MIHTVKSFSVVNEAEVVVFPELPCFLWILAFSPSMIQWILATWSLVPLPLWMYITRNSISVMSPQSYTIAFYLFILVSYFFLRCFFLFQLFMLKICNCTSLLIFSYHSEISPYPSPEGSFYFPHLDLLLLASMAFLFIGFVFQRHISLSLFWEKFMSGVWNMSSFCYSLDY